MQDASVKDFIPFVDTLPLGVFFSPGSLRRGGLVSAGPATMAFATWPDWSDARPDGLREGEVAADELLGVFATLADETAVLSCDPSAGALAHGTAASRGAAAGERRRLSPG